MNNNNVNKFFPGSIVVGRSVETKNVTTDKINDLNIEEYITSNDIPNSPTLKEFVEVDGGLAFKGVTLIPPNEVMVDRAYTDTEMEELIDKLWDEYAVTDDSDDALSEELNTGWVDKSGNDYTNEDGGDE